MTQPDEKMIFDFDTDSGKMNWNIIDDGVMGGKSQSTFQILRSDVARFSGTVSLENNGGFASVRSAPQDHNLAGYTGIKIRVNGDGKIYKLRLKCDANFDGITYQAEFKTRDGEWLEVQLPFDEFIPVFRGRQLQNVGKLEPEAIQQIGFLISNKQAGKFELLVDWIKAYKTVK